MPEWINLDSDVNGITVNQYFVQHPEMILGEMKEVSGPYGMETTCAQWKELIWNYSYKKL